MSRIRGKDTSIEKMLRKQLYASNHRYRKNVSSLPGHPDILLSKYRICIFCDGDFFHGYDLNRIESQLKENKDYWYQKILKNQQRDRKAEVKLVSLGYVVLRFWEHEIKHQMKDVMNEILIFVEAILFFSLKFLVFGISFHSFEYRRKERENAIGAITFIEREI